MRKMKPAVILLSFLTAYFTFPKAATADLKMQKEKGCYK